MIQDPIDMIKDLLFVITILKDSYHSRQMMIKKSAYS